MTSVLIIGDVHLSDKAPRSRKDTYTEEVLAKLARCVEYANEYSLPIVQAGDMFHIKAPSRTSHRLVQATHDVLREANHGVFIVPGNHDLQHDRLDSIQSQPLGALCRMSNVNLFMGRHEDLPGIWAIPYLTEFDGDDWKAGLDHWIPPKNWTRPELIVTHAPLFPPGQAPGVYASIDPTAWASYWDGTVDATYYGHIHEPHGTYSVKPSLALSVPHRFCNNGAISRGSLHEETVNRWPTVTLWDGATFMPIPLPSDVVKAPQDVFLFEQAEQAKADKSSAADFADAIGRVQLANLTPEEVIADIRKANPPKMTMRVIEDVVEHASA